METQTPAAPTEAEGTTPPASSRQKIKPWVRIVAFVAVLFTGWHVLASFLWIAPYSANAREIVPGKALSSYMLPFFGQSWSVFAPEPINGDYHYNVRAVLADEDGTETDTGWVSATDVELSMIRYNLAPPRAGIQSTELASSYKGAFDALTEQQRAVVAGDFVVDSWEVGLEAALIGQDDAEETKVSAFLAEEHRSTAYATQVAHAIWGDDVVSVQFRVSRQNIIPFVKRHTVGAERPAPTIVLPGKRGLLVEEGQNEGNFANVFRAQYERISK